MSADQPPAHEAGNEAPATPGEASIVGSHIPNMAALAGNTMFPCRRVPGLSAPADGSPRPQRVDLLGPQSGSKPRLAPGGLEAN